MKKLLVLLFSIILFGVLSGCWYGGVASHNGKLYILRNDQFLFGALRAVYECSPAGNGTLNCVKAADSP